MSQMMRRRPLLTTLKNDSLSVFVLFLSVTVYDIMYKYCDIMYKYCDIMYKYCGFVFFLLLLFADFTQLVHNARQQQQQVTRLIFDINKRGDAMGWIDQLDHNVGQQLRLPACGEVAARMHGGAWVVAGEQLKISVAVCRKLLVIAQSDIDSEWQVSSDEAE